MKLSFTRPSRADQKLCDSFHLAAQESLAAATAEIKRFQRQLEQMAGCPILINRNVKGAAFDSKLSFIRTGAAKNGHYSIDIRPMGKPIEVHALARQLIRLQIELEDAAAGEPAIFTPNASRILELAPMGDVIGLAQQRQRAGNFGQSLIFIPQEMLIDTRLLEKFPVLTPAQKYWALTYGSNKAMQIYYLQPEEKRFATPWRRAYNGLFGSLALHRDHLLKEPKVLDYYQQLPTWKLSERIYAAYQKHQATSRPGMLSRFIDNVCKLTGFPDAVRHKFSPIIPCKSTPQAGEPGIN